MPAIEQQARCARCRDPEAAKALLQQLTDAGLHVLLDDFGTGYSSLQHLRHLPISGLKIDRSFIHELGFKITAEGVETLGQTEILRQLGCDLAPGFHFARPMSEAAYSEWVQQYTRSLTVN